MRTFYFLLLLVYATSISQAQDYQWKVSDISENESPFWNKYISALDTSTFVIATSAIGLTYFRMIQITEDYGQTWDTIYYEDFTDKGYPDFYNYLFTDVKYLDKNNIIALAGYKRMLKTSDQGKTWVDTSYFDDAFPYTKICSRDSLVFVAGTSTKFAKSTDMGNTWKLISPEYQIDSVEKYEQILVREPVFYNDKLYMSIIFKDKVEFLSNMKYFVDNIYLESTDDGETWEQLFTNKNAIASTFYAVNEESIITQTTEVTFEDLLIHSPQGGIDTVQDATPHYKIVKYNKNSGDLVILADSNSINMQNLNSLSMFDNVLCLNSVSGTYISTDSGVSWTEEVKAKNFSSSAPFNSIERISPNKGMAVGIGFFCHIRALNFSCRVKRLCF